MTNRIIAAAALLIFVSFPLAATAAPADITYPRNGVKVRTVYPLVKWKTEPGWQVHGFIMSRSPKMRGPALKSARIHVETINDFGMGKHWSSTKPWASSVQYTDEKQAAFAGVWYYQVWAIQECPELECEQYWTPPRRLTVRKLFGRPKISMEEGDLFLDFTYTFRMQTTLQAIPLAMTMRVNGVTACNHRESMSYNQDLGSPGYVESKVECSFDLGSIKAEGSNRLTGRTVIGSKRTTDGPWVINMNELA